MTGPTEQPEVNKCAVCGRTGYAGVLSLDYRDGEPHLILTCWDCWKTMRRHAPSMPPLTLTDRGADEPVSLTAEDTDDGTTLHITLADGKTITLDDKDRTRMEAWLKRLGQADGHRRTPGGRSGEQGSHAHERRRHE